MLYVPSALFPSYQKTIFPDEYSVNSAPPPQTLWVPRQTIALALIVKPTTVAKISKIFFMIICPYPWDFFVHLVRITIRFSRSDWLRECFARFYELSALAAQWFKCSCSFTSHLWAAAMLYMVVTVEPSSDFFREISKNPKRCAMLLRQNAHLL